MKFELASERSLFSTIRIETRLEHGEFVVGTAFIYEYTTEDNSYPFLITAKNLIENATEGRITLIQGKNRQPMAGKGYTLDIENFSKLWFNHPDEILNVAVTPFVPFVKHVENTGVSIFFETFTETTVFPPGADDKLALGEDLMYLGYPETCWDEKYLLPVFRRAMLSAPYSVNFFGRPQAVVDANVVKGSCGSPVFIKNQFTPNSISGSLLGLLSNIPSKHINEDGTQHFVEDVRIQTSMGLVIKMEVAIEAIIAYLKEKGFI